jgi:hypothetical protein
MKHILLIEHVFNFLNIYYNIINFGRFFYLSILLRIFLKQFGKDFLIFLDPLHAQVIIIIIEKNLIAQISFYSIQMLQQLYTFV